MRITNLTLLDSTADGRRVCRCAENYIKDFPYISFERGSTVVSATIHINADMESKHGLHSIQIGKYCSMADNLVFIVNANHEYLRATTSSFLGWKTDNRLSGGGVYKGEILIQNDVWLGSGATIMSGVVIRNGACVAANSHVVKDVPPYTIIGGNPARVIGQRFTDEQIDDMQRIAWWDWPDEKILEEYPKTFSLPIQEFIDAYIADAPPALERTSGGGILFFSDTSELFATMPHVLKEYAVSGLAPDLPLVISFPKEYAGKEGELKKMFAEQLDGVQVVAGKGEEELMAQADYFVTSRHERNVYHSCLADRYGACTISGFDKPIFRP